jgi:acetylornithine deacetylase/succinyl-diaminopimelate desuccinylase-like protein
MLGSHIDTVINAGIYDGCYGVLSGLEVIETLKEAGFVPSRPIAVAAFTNEEGVRYAPERSAEEDVTISVERLARFEPVKFDERIVAAIEAVAKARALSCRRMTSGAGHDAQMIARIAPAAMIFVPSKGGISHNPKEFTADEDLIAGANILVDVVRKLTEEE